jgi:hypothetical protein
MPPEAMLAQPVPPFPTPSVPVRKFTPILEDEMMFLFASSERSVEAVRLESVCVPETVKLVVLAPPFSEMRPVVTVREPKLADWEKRLVLDAVEAKKEVEVPEVSESVPKVESPATFRVPMFAVFPFTVVEVAVPKKPVPETVSAVEEAYGKVEAIVVEVATR